MDIGVPQAQQVARQPQGRHSEGLPELSRDLPAGPGAHPRKTGAQQACRFVLRQVPPEAGRGNSTQPQQEGYRSTERPRHRPQYRKIYSRRLHIEDRSADQGKDPEGGDV